MTRLALWLHRQAARLLLPRSLRAEYAEELEATVAERLARARGPVARSLALLAELADLVRAAVQEWKGELGSSAQWLTNGPGRGGLGMGSLWTDIKTGGRSLARRPPLALTVAMTIGVGIGATTTVYSVVDAVLLRPLPFDDPDQLVVIGSTDSGAPPDPATGLQDLAPLSSDTYRSFVERARSFTELGGIMPGRMVVSDENDIQVQVTAAGVTPELFEILSAAPVLGRAFLAEEYAVGSGVAMISYEYWQSRYGEDPGVLGQPLQSSPASQQRHVIVGVMREGFAPPEALFPSGEVPRVWTPLPLAAPGSGRRIVFTAYALGRLGPAATLVQAREEAALLALALDTEPAGTLDARRGVRSGIGVNDLHAQTVGTAGRTLWVFLGAAGMLLLLTALNAAALFLARALDRAQELGVRMALGSGRGRVVRLLVAEAGMLSVLGGALGVVGAYLGVAAFVRFAPPSIPRIDAVAVDARVLAVAALTTLLIGLAAGLLPALRLTAPGPWERLQSSGRTVAEPASKLRSMLVGGQLAVAVVLLAGAGLLFESFLRIRTAHPGFEPKGLIVLAPTATGPMRMTIGALPNALQLWDPILQSLGSVPGVETVAGASLLPFQTPNWAPRLLLPEDDDETVREGVVGYVVTPDYLAAMGSRILQGRGLQPGDGPDSEAVALVNEAFVRSQLGGRNPLGLVVRRAREGVGGGGWVATRIVGVVEDIVQSRVEDAIRPAIYLPYAQADLPQILSWWAVARTDRLAEASIPELRRALSEHDRLPQSIGPMEERMSEARATPRFQALLLGAFAAVAILLAAAGLHGSLAHAVRRRQRELGVRMALGADRRSVLGMVLARGMRVALVGLALGMLATLALSRVLAAFLYDLEPYDPGTLVAVAAALLAVSAAACLAPARRATAVDPARILSAE